MPTVVIMPALGMAQDTGKVVRWLRAEGDVVEQGEPLLEIETDKVTVEIEAPAAGSARRDLRGRGRRRPGRRGDRLGARRRRVARRRSAAASRRAAGPGASAERRSPPRRHAGWRRAAASTLARVAGSGPGGAIVAADVAPSTAPRLPAHGLGLARDGRADDRELAVGAAVPPPPRRRRDAPAELARRRARRSRAARASTSPTCS